MSDDFQAALAVALRRLKDSDRFESEVRGALSKYEPDTVEQVVSHLREKRFLNDHRVATNLVERNEGRRAVGSEKLRATLERRGAPEAEIDAAVATVSESEPENAKALLETKFAGQDPADRARAGRFLYSRGFTEDTIESALEAYFPTT